MPEQSVGDYRQSHRWRRLGHVALMPTATQITVKEVLGRLDAEFDVVARAVENGEFALWVGSGISRRAPSLGGLIESAMEFVRVRAVDGATSAEYLPALREAIQLAEMDPTTLEHRFATPYPAWPEAEAITGVLWNRYSRVLDIRIAGTQADFILWDAINIRAEFANPRPPAAQHLCIAILILEGAISTIASANWDGFIEVAVNRLSGGVAGVLQVVVDPAQMRDPPGRAQLLKFHGCIVHATDDPGRYRQYLTGSHTQINDWPEEPRFAAMRGLVVSAATNKKTLVLGLSIQDANLQNVFTKAKAVNPWPWPCAPAAAAHVFCEDRIAVGQRDVLRIVYGDAYNDNIEAIHSGSHIRAWAEQVLIALVLRTIADKLAKLMEMWLAAAGKGLIAGALQPSIVELRDAIADWAIVDTVDESRTPATDRGIQLWSRMLAMFRTGALPVSNDAYETLSPSSLSMLAADPNSLSNGLGQLATAFALLQHGRVVSRWTIAEPETSDVAAGCATARSSRAGAPARPLFIVKSAADAITLQERGAFANDNAVVIHADDTWLRIGASARRVRGAPGRTGHVAPIHVSINEMVGRSGDAAELQRVFAAELIL